MLNSDMTPTIKDLRDAEKNFGFPQVSVSHRVSPLMKLVPRGDTTVVDADEPPLRVFFGDWPLEAMKAEDAKRIAEWEAWHDLSVRAFGAVNA